MEYRVPKVTPIRWPDKCVWCMGQATRTYKLKGGTWAGKKFRVEVYCPICKKHYFLLKGKEVSIVVVIALAAIFAPFLWLFVGIYYHDEEWPYLIYIASILIYILVWFAFEPVRIYEGEDFYEIVIRSSKYAREFAEQNNLNQQLSV
jgi:hypothetical protein